MARSQPPNTVPPGRRVNWGRREVDPVPRTQPPRWPGNGAEGGPAGVPRGGFGAAGQSAGGHAAYPHHNEPQYSDQAGYHYPHGGQQAGGYGPGGLAGDHQGGGFPPAYPPLGPAHDPYGNAGRFDNGGVPDQPYPPAHDPQYYDLNQYAVPAYPQQPGYGGGGHDVPYPEPALQDFRQGPGQYDARGGYYDEPPHPGLGPQGAPPHGHAQHYGHGPQHHGPQHMGGGRNGYEADEYEEYEEEEPRRKGSRVWFLTVALIGSIAIGGGLAFGYKTLVGSDPGKASVVRAQNAPARMAPSDPGGRRVAGTDSKLMGRLEAEAGAGGVAQADQTGVRKVSTFVVGRDGSVAPVANQGASAGSSGGVADIPGFEIVDGFGGTSAGAPRAAPAPRNQVIARAPEAAGERPRVAVNRITTVPPDAPDAGGPAAASEPPMTVRAPERSRPAPVQEKRERVAAVSKPQPAPPGDAATARGYVAVLSSKGSRMDALQAFADLREKFPDVLGTKIPDVQTSDQSGRGLGVVYRAVAGPPGSRQAASAVCKQLKTAGHDGCWVTAY